MKKTVSVLVMVAMLLAIISIPVAGESSLKTEPYVAEVLFEKNLLRSQVAIVEPDNGAAPSTAVRAGSACWLLDKDKGNDQLYINLAFDKKFKPAGNDGSTYDVEVEYMDMGNGWFRIMYDSYSADRNQAEAFYMTGTQTWKTAKITLFDAEFNRALNGKYDMQLSIYEPGYNNEKSAESIPIRRIKVTRNPGRNPIYASAKTDKVGNAFRWFDESKLIHTTLINTTGEEKSADVTYRLINEYGYVGFSKTESVTFAPYENKEVDIDFGELERCDTYWFEVIVKSADGKIDSAFQLFPMAVLKTDPNGIKNRRAQINTHIDRYAESQQEPGLEVLSLSNTGGIRSGVNWIEVENPKGVFSLDRADMSAKLFERIKKYDFDYLPFLSGMASWLGGQWHTMSHTPEQLEGWGVYAAYIAETFGDYVDKYEIWNEPNIPGFNQFYESAKGDVYMEMFRVASENIKRVDPDAKVGGPSFADVRNPSGLDYWKGTLDNGLAEIADAIAVHPYTYNQVESSNVGELVQGFSDEFKKAGNRDDAPMWHTEIGYTTTDSAVQNSHYQGAYDVRLYIYYTSRNLNDIMYFYNFEKKGDDLTNRESQFGMVSAGHEKRMRYGTYYIPTESYVMLSALNYIMAEADPCQNYDDVEGNLYVSEFDSRKFNKKIVTMYTNNESKIVTMDLGADKVTFFDEYGNEEELYGEDGIYTFHVNETVRYVMGDITKVEILPENSLIDYKAAKYSAADEDTFAIEVYNKANPNYTLEAVTPEEITLIENTGFVNGKALLLFEKKASERTTLYVDVLVKDGEKTVQKSRIEIYSNGLFEADFKTELIDSSDPNVWRGVIKLKNLSNSRTITGEIDFLSPDTFEKLKGVDVGIIPPATTGEIVFTLPKITKKGKYYIEYTMNLDDGSVYNLANTIDFSIALYAKSKPAIDGVLEKGEWNFNTAMHVDNADAVKQKPTWSGPEDLSGRSMVMWDEENIYMAYVVKDNKHVNIAEEGRNWNGDSVQFGVVFEDDGFVAYGQSNITFHEISLAHSTLRDDCTVWRYGSQNDCYSPGAVTDAELAVTTGKGETYYEFKMPWKSLLKPGQQVESGDVLGFSYVINDSDAELRQGWIEYTEGIAGTKNSTLFTTIKLVD